MIGLLGLLAIGIIFWIINDRIQKYYSIENEKIDEQIRYQNITSGQPSKPGSDSLWFW